ncbi:MAG: hypothetical protein LC749_19030 [Actinobacteria bacterium]|nr:hypothetical protein [Actinomycetota bacterium]
MKAAGLFLTVLIGSAESPRASSTTAPPATAGMAEGEHMKTLARVTVLAALAVALLAGPASAQTGTNQRFTIIGAGTGSNPVIAAGVINAVGTESSTRDPAHPNVAYTSTFAFPQGDLFSTITPGRPQVRFDQTTCVTRITEHDTFIFAGGTEKYAGASGTGTATVNVTAVAGRNADGSCLGSDSRPAFVRVVIRGAGNLSLS